MASRLLTDLTDNLQQVFPELKARFEKENPGFYLKCICSHRSVEEQQALWKKGRNAEGKVVDPSAVVTKIDGIKNKSNHNYLPAKAFDVGIFTQGVKSDKYLPTSPLYKTLGKYVYGLNVHWGGNFKSFKDYPHFEEW